MNLESISNGEWDQVLAQWASVIKALEYPVLIAFAPQVNNNHYPWHLTRSTDTAQTYIDAFQYIVTFFRDLDTLNVYWVWEISSQPNPKTIWNNAQNAYPGDEYVDWICIYGQNFGTEHTWSKWQPLENIVANSLKEIQHYQKPIALRVHTTDAGGSSQKWSNDIPMQLQSSLSSVQLLIISQDNYKHIAQNSLFKANLDNFQKIKAYPTNPSTELPHLDLPIPINLPQSITQGAYHWHGPSDLSATVQLNIDDKTFTVTIDLTDDYLAVYNNNQDNLVLGDSIELFINNAHFALNTQNSHSLWDLKNHKSIQSSDITYTKTKTSTHIQIKLPFTLFIESKLEQFKIIINDFDNLDTIFQFQIFVFELVLRVELKQKDILNDKIAQIKSNFKKILKLKEFKKEADLVKILFEYSSGKDFNSKIDLFIKEFEKDTNDRNTIIDYVSWSKKLKK